jgi:hypothetical protein
LIERASVAKRLAVSVALLVMLLGGWLWGASARRGEERARQAAELRNDLLEARASLLAARVALYDADIPDMNRHLEDAGRFAGRARVRLDTLGWQEEAQRLNLAGFAAEIDAAQRLGARLDSPVQPRAPEATPPIEQPVGTLVRR